MLARSLFRISASSCTELNPSSSRRSDSVKPPARMPRMKLRKRSLQILVFSCASQCLFGFCFFNPVELVSPETS